MLLTIQVKYRQSYNIYGLYNINRMNEMYNNFLLLKIQIFYYKWYEMKGRNWIMFYLSRSYRNLVWSIILFRTIFDCLKIEIMVISGDVSKRPFSKYLVAWSVATSWSLLIATFGTTGDNDDWSCLSGITWEADDAPETQKAEDAGDWAAVMFTWTTDSILKIFNCLHVVTLLIDL